MVVAITGVKEIITVFMVPVVLFAIYLFEKYVINQDRELFRIKRLIVDDCTEEPYNASCPVCLNPMQEGAIANCKHVFCAQCIKELLLRHHWSRLLKCPLCRQQIKLLHRYSNNDGYSRDRDLRNAIIDYDRFSLLCYTEDMDEEEQVPPYDST